MLWNSTVSKNVSGRMVSADLADVTGIDHIDRSHDSWFVKQS